MFGFFLKKKVKSLEEETKKSFSSVKDDFNSVSKWIKHLDRRDKQLFDMLNIMRNDLSSIQDDLAGLKEAFEIQNEDMKNKQVFKKLPVLDEQTPVGVVQKTVQTAVQTGNIYENLKGLSSNERLLVMTLANSEMKLSYEDLAMLLAKERSTVRGQINSIKQKSEGLIQEIIERNGKKRIFVPEVIKQKFEKYVKVRGGRGTKGS